MTSTELEGVILRFGLEHVDNTASVFVMVQTLEHHVVSLWLFEVSQLINGAVCFDLERKAVLANSAFKLLPVVRL